MVDLNHLDYKFYQYNPNVVAPAIFVVLFALATGIHAYFAWQFKAKFFIAFLAGGLCEIIGYIGRALSHNNEKKIGPYVMQNLLLLVAPSLFAATIYMILGRIIRLLDAQHYSIIPVAKLTKVFVIGDLFCFWIQGGGGGLQAVGSTLFYNLGRWIIVGGLILQVAVFCFFVIVAIKFHTRINREPTAASSDPQIPWRKHMTILYATSGLILVRNVVRVVEYVQGTSGWVISHEFMLYIFDSVPMLLVFVLFLIVHPCKLFMTQQFRASRAQDSEQDMLEMGMEVAQTKH